LHVKYLLPGCLIIIEKPKKPGKPSFCRRRSKLQQLRLAF
jgi:hypothetical protein